MGCSNFIIVPFLAGKGRALHPGAPICLRLESYARAVAAEAARLYAGIAILEQPDNTFEEPRLVGTLGRVPRLMAARMA